MSTQSAGTAIKEARLKAGLSQEKLSEGICSALSLSRIENGTAGVSPTTFQALMAHVGSPCEAFPVFANRTDFDCFYSLKRARFYVDSWQLQEAYDELEKIEKWGFANNKFNYQEWLLLHSRLQFRSGMGDHSHIRDMLLHAIHISRPNIDFMDFRSLLLSINEIALLIYYAQEELYRGEQTLCLSICEQLSDYLENSKVSFLEKDRLVAENAVVYSKYLLAIEDYKTHHLYTTRYVEKLSPTADDTSRHELYFLTGLGYYLNNKPDEALSFFRTAFYSAHSIGSCYATICRNYLITKFGIDVHSDVADLCDIALTAFPQKKVMEPAGLSDGSYDLFSTDVLTIGHLIQELRIEQNISQQALCQGLCSKSKLSKIENGTLHPRAILAETLLQRLGISERAFTFYSSDNESELHELKTRTALTPATDRELLLQNITQMEKLLSADNQLYYQYILFRKIFLTDDVKTKLELLEQALKITQPTLDLKHLNGVPLSWCELNILNQICAFNTQGPSALKGIVLFYNFLDYLTHTNRDILDQKRFFNVFLARMIRHLYINKQFTEICDLSIHFTKPALKGCVNIIGNIYSHYVQALGECGRVDEMLLYAYYTYYNFKITNSTHTEHFKKVMYDDWNLLLR